MSHYRPKAIYRTADASKHCYSLLAALEPWVQAASAGKKRHRLASPLSATANRSADDLLCDCAGALAEAFEWDGALLAHHLAARGWPVDVELVRLCHTWSTALMDRIMATYRARQPASAFARVSPTPAAAGGRQGGENPGQTPGRQQPATGQAA